MLSNISQVDELPTNHHEEEGSFDKKRNQNVFADNQQHHGKEKLSLTMELAMARAKTSFKPGLAIKKKNQQRLQPGASADNIVLQSDPLTKLALDTVNKKQMATLLPIAEQEEPISALTKKDIHNEKTSAEKRSLNSSLDIQKY